MNSLDVLERDTVERENVLNRRERKVKETVSAVSREFTRNHANTENKVAWNNSHVTIPNKHSRIDTRTRVFVAKESHGQVERFISVRVKHVSVRNEGRGRKRATRERYRTIKHRHGYSHNPVRRHIDEPTRTVMRYEWLDREARNA